MVIGMIKDAARYDGLGSRVAEALKWLQTADLAALQEGRSCSVMSVRIVRR